MAQSLHNVTPNSLGKPGLAGPGLRVGMEVGGAQDRTVLTKR